MLKPGIYKVKQNATNGQLQAAIESVIPMATKQMAGQAKQYKGKSEIETCRNIFVFLKGLNYKADGNEQQVRLPSALMRTRTGDCKSYSVFTSAVLSNLKIPHYLTYTSYNPNDKTPTHVYVTTKNGCIIDAVYGIFNKEKKPSFKINKTMNISYIAGIKSPRYVSLTAKEKQRLNYLQKREDNDNLTKSENLEYELLVKKYRKTKDYKNRIGNTNSGACGIMATEGALEWASRNGINLTNAQKIAIGAQKVLPAAMIGRAVVRNIIQKNSGGIASSLQAARVAAGSQRPGQPDWDRIRKIELNWLNKGGNPNELYESIAEGSTKTPTGKKFYEVLQTLSSGGSVGLGDYIAAAISALFGKKYNPATGAITGTGIMGEPATTTTAVVTSAPWWQAAIKEITIALGTAYINRGGAGTRGAAGEIPTTPTGPITPDTGAGEGARRDLTPILLIGGAAAALYFITKKK
jgi:hypothetical protein